MHAKVFDFINRYDASMSLSRGGTRPQWWVSLTWIPENKCDPVQAEGYGDTIQDAFDSVCSSPEFKKGE